VSDEICRTFHFVRQLARCRNRRNEIALRLEIRKKSGKPRGGSPRAAYVVIVERGH